MSRTLKLGYKNFDYIEKDAGLKFVRNTKGYKELIEKYKIKQV